MAKTGSVKKSGAPGEPHIIAEIPQEAIQRFNSKLLTQPNGCVYYSGAVQNQGYCNFYYRRISDNRIRYVTAHKFSAMTSGKFTEDQINEYCVLHDCDQHYDKNDISYRQCVNPDHLWIGTVQDNIQDCIKKGRYKKPPTKRGEDNYNATLTQSQAEWVIENHYKITQQRMAEILNLSPSTIQAIHMNKTWRHLPR